MTLRKIEKIVTNAVSALLTTLKKNDIFQFLFTSKVVRNAVLAFVTTPFVRNAETAFVTTRGDDRVKYSYFVYILTGYEPKFSFITVDT